MSNNSMLESMTTDRKRRISVSAKPDSIFSRSLLVNILLAVFCLTDFVTLYTVWNHLLTESPLALIFIVTAFVVGLDVSMSIAGNVIKQCTVKLRRMRDTVPIVICCVLAFVIACASYMGLRITMTEQTFGNTGSQTVLEDVSGSDESDDSEKSGVSAAGIAASYGLALLPIVTSLMSIAASYAISNPIKEKLSDLKKQRADLQKQIASVNALITEAGDVDKHIQGLYEREKSLHQALTESIEMTVLRLRVTVRRLIMEKLGASDPDMINDMADDIAELMAASQSSSKPGNTGTDSADDNRLQLTA